MSEKKATLVSLIVMVLFGGVLLCLRLFQPPIYYILMQIFAILGLAAFGFWFFCWLQYDDQPVQDADYMNVEQPDNPKTMFDQDHCDDLFNSASSIDYGECQNVNQ